MALDLTQQYPQQVDGSTPAYPLGKARNVTSPDDNNATPLDEAWLNDHFGFQQALLSEAGIVPSGIPDQVGASQYLEALKSVGTTAGNVTFVNRVGATTTQEEINRRRVSLLDFDAPYSTDSTEQLQAALDYLDAQGGGVLDIPYHTGELVISGAITPYSNIRVNCDRNLSVDCSGRTSGYSFDLRGTTEAEVLLNAHRTTGDTEIRTKTAHNCAPGDDVLIISQRECAHADAGKLWRLGETTASVSSPFFAEPIVVTEKLHDLAFNIEQPLIFPDYRTDKTRETSPFARDSSSIMKMNLAKRFEWVGGIFKKESGSIFHLMWTRDCYIDIEVKRGYGTGQEVYNRFSLNTKARVKVSRPPNWILETDHSAYNSMKDISSWYTEMWLDEENGCQGLDQSYTTYCGIMPTYHIRHINSHEDAMTTHGCVYGAEINVYAMNCNYAAVRNRARFVKGKVFASNCHQGLRNSGWGVPDTEFDVFLVGCRREGVNLASEGVTAVAPARKNCRISGTIIMAPTATGPAIVVKDNADAASRTQDSNIILRDLFIRSYNRAIYTGVDVHGVTIDNVHIEQFSTTSPLYLRLSAGHKVRNLTVDYKVSVPDDIVAVFGNTLSSSADVAAYGNPAWQVDFDSCKVSAGMLLTDDDRLYSNSITFAGNSGFTDLQRLTRHNANKDMKIHLSSGVASENRLLLEKDLAVGRVIRVLFTSADPSYTLNVYPPVATGYNLNFLGSILSVAPRTINGDRPKYFYIQRVSATDFNVYN